MAEWQVVSYAKKKPSKPVVKTEPVSQPVRTMKGTPQTKAITSKVDHGKINHLSKLEKETEDFHVKKVSLSVAREISGKRVAKGWSQKELAQRCNFPAKEIHDVENGTALYDGSKIDKIKRILG